MSKLIVEWGTTTFENQSFKDGKVWNTATSGKGITEWDWIQDGTRHKPGITKKAITDILKHSPDTVILTQGFDGRLQNSNDIIEWLASKNIKVFSAQTKEAVNMFNHLVKQGESVAGLFHSTC